MRLTLMTDYAVRLLLFVAQHPDRLCTIAEIAQAYRVSEAHLMKVTHLLGQRGWIETVRGKGGGMRLACDPEAINLGQLVRDVEPDFNIVECFGDTDRCVLTGNCRLSGIVNGALQSFLGHLDGFTLADILPSGDLSSPATNVRPREQRIVFQRRKSA